MRVALDPEHLALRAELREYFDQLVTPERRAGLASATGEFGEAGVYKEVIRQIGTDGWLGIGWPEEYGGQARSMIEQLIFTDAAAVAGVPIPYLTLNTVGPTIMRYGTDEQKEYFLPKILAGDLHFSIGYSEPGSGTDLASLRTRATREGDEWVINGQKMWTSLIQYADWIWLACRTDPDLPRHKGLSMILVPADAPGVSYTPVHTVAGVGTSATYYEDVRVPASNLVGRAQRRLVADDQPAQPRAGRPHLGRSARALAQAGARVGPADQEPRRPARDRHRVGADRARPRPRPDRGAQPDQLEAGRRRRREGRPLPRRGLGHQDLRLRARHRGLPRR